MNASAGTLPTAYYLASCHHCGQPVNIAQYKIGAKRRLGEPICCRGCAANNRKPAQYAPKPATDYAQCRAITRPDRANLGINL